MINNNLQFRFLDVTQIFINMPYFIQAQGTINVSKQISYKQTESLSDGNYSLAGLAATSVTFFSVG